MQNSSSFLDQDYAIDTPENVTFAYEVAGIGNRFIAALVDSIAIFAALVLLNVMILVGLGALGEMEASVAVEEEPLSWVGGLLIALYALLNFLIFWGYYVLFEYLWNGQTPGKRLVKIRVARTDGNPAGFVEVVIRNLVRVVDFLPTGYGLGLLVMFFSPQARRLGDFAAGTLVVKERSDVDLRALSPPSALAAAESGRGSGGADEALFLRYVHIRRLSAADTELIQETLARWQHRRVTADVLHRLARVMAAKLDVEPPAPAQTVPFLRDVLGAHRQIASIGTNNHLQGGHDE